MPNQPKYTIKDFQNQFKSDGDCLAYIFKQKYPNGLTCEVCKTENAFRPVTGRRSYACSCGNQIYPTKGTIFQGSPTSLVLWFFAIYLFGQSKNGVSAKELQRQLGVTYKCAWRIAASIRRLMDYDDTPLSGDVEVDESHFGGKEKNKNKLKQVRENMGQKPKTVVFGAVERKGRVAISILNHPRLSEVLPLLENMIAKGSQIYSDDSYLYKHHLSKMGYKHNSVIHRKREFVRGSVHTNTIESFWSLVKRSFDGTYHVVSPDYLSSYLAEFVFRYNHRRASQPMFLELLAQL